MVTSQEFRHRLEIRAAAALITVSADLQERLERYYRLLCQWNLKINLTAIDVETLPDPALDRLFVEPLAAARFSPAEARVIDIGSGGGSPAIPFALGATAAQLTMVESRARKSVFLNEAARACGLAATVITERAEMVATDPRHQGAYGVLTVRAVRLDEPTVAGMKRLLTPTGRMFVFHKTGSSPSIDGPAVQHHLCSDAELTIF